MSKEQAAIADVVAKMRRFADRHWMHPACQVVREFADMIDSVLKRDCEVVVSKNATTTNESLVVGNAAAMRDALVKIRDIVTADAPADEVEIANIAYLALAAPPRQCDVGTAEEQAARMRAFCAKNGLCRDGAYRCENCGLLYEFRCELKWAQMPYEEGGNDGSK